MSATTCRPPSANRWPTRWAPPSPTGDVPGRIPPSAVATARGVNLIYQFWIHTEAIDRIGRAEASLNTPSHHRVHHGSNGHYLDRNHGGILIVWDKLFGTFEPEDERVVYGLTTNIDTFNPRSIASHEYAEMLRDVARSRTWVDRVGCVLRGPGWAGRRRAEQLASARQTCGSQDSAEPGIEGGLLAETATAPAA